MSLSGKEARAKGHSFELFIVNTLKKLGFHAVSARSESKNLDDRGCDIVDNTPFSIQCKAVERLNMSNHQLLAEMKCNGLEKPIVVHKRNHKGVTVTMRWEEFEFILRKLE